MCAVHSYLNVQDPLTVAFGPDTPFGELGRFGRDFKEALLNWANSSGGWEHDAALLVDCLAPPPQAFVFPRDLYATQ